MRRAWFARAWFARARISGVLIALAALTFLPGCPGKPAESRPAAPAESALSAAETDAVPEPEEFSVRDRIPIRVVYHDTETEDNSRWLNLAVAAFEASHPTVKVILSPVYGTEPDYANKLSLSLKSDPTIDVILFDGALLSAFINSGYLVGFMADTWRDWIENFPGKTKATVAWRGLEYAMPVSLEVPGLFYNANTFKKAGLPVPWHPETWDDVESAAKALAAVAEYPVWMSGSSSQSEETAFRTFGTVLSGTGDWIYGEGGWVASSPGMLETLDFLHRLFQDDGIMDNLPRSVMLSRHSLDTLARKLVAGEIGILLHSTRLGPAIARTTTLYRDDILVTPFPARSGGMTSVTGGWMLGISSLSANKFISFEFLKSALSPEIQRVSCTVRGDIPVRRDVETSDAWRSENWYASQMSDYLYFSRFRPDAPEYPQVASLLAMTVESVITGTRTPAQACADYATALGKIAPVGPADAGAPR